MKERLVGAAVLVAVAVWLVPWVLDGPDSSIDSTGSSLQLPAAEEPMPMRTQTLRLGDPEPAESPSASQAGGAAQPEASGPPASTVSTASPPAAEPPRAATPQSARAEAETGGTAPPRAAAVPKSAPATPAAGDWTVQLGSFGEEVNARGVAQRASTFGYKAEVSRTTSGGRTLFRVRVGPQATRAAADATASALRAHGLEASVVAAR